MLMTRENLKEFKNRSNVTKVTNEETGSISYLTQSITFGEEANNTGATIVDTFESETKHVMLFFNDDNTVVGKYYMGKKLQGKTPEELLEQKSVLCIFESWNPNVTDNAGNVIGGWVPCVGLAKNQGPSEHSARI